MERNQITFYNSFYKAIRRIKKKADRCDAYDALFDYAFSGILPDLDALPDSAAIAFDLVKPNLDAAKKKADGGKKGRPVKDAEKMDERCSKDTTNKKEREKEKEVEIENECYICPEPAPLISLPLNDGTEFGVTEAMVSEFSQLYPAVDILQSLRNMRGWLLNNPTNRKTARGIRRFINLWLCKEQDKAPAAKRQQNYVHGVDRLAQMIAQGEFDD